MLIVGAGPVGLTLALDLGRRGIRTTLIEKREQVLRLPKMERSNPRTMEIYRRLGVVDRIRAAAYPADASMDVLILRSMLQAPLVHQVYPSVAQARASIAACDDGSLPREPYQLVSQYTLEALLLSELRNCVSLEIRLGVELVDLTQSADGVEARVRSTNTSGSTQLRARYAVACDGANSTVRQLLGLSLEGAAGLGAIANIFFRCSDLLDKSRVPRARHYLFAGVDASGGAAGSMVVQDDQKHFASHLPVALSQSADLAGELRRRTGLDIQPEILFAGRWTQNMMVADRHAVGRVFLAGDANHVFIPAGGLGMNTGIGDATNLAWKLAAMIAGWGGPGLLQSYSTERGAVARRNIKAVAYAVDGVIAWRKIPVPTLGEDATANASADQAYAEKAAPLNRRVYEMHGTDLGYRYESEVICGESGNPPADDSYQYRPTTWPGAHLPHMWLAPGVALYDRMTSGYQLIRCGASAANTDLLAAALRRRGVPLEVLDIPDERIRAAFGCDCLLVRPDLHVAWRGNHEPDNPDAVAAVVTGHRTVSASA